MPRPWARTLVLAVVVLYLCHAALFLGGIMDDAYISFRYARNLLDGLGLVFNPGERVEGYTNFSWVMLSAASLALEVPPTVTTPVVGALCGVLLVVCVARAGARLSRREQGSEGGAGLYGALLVAVTTGLALYAVSGLEETAFTLLTTLAALALVERRLKTFALWTSLAFLTRPEAGLLGVVALGFVLSDLRKATPAERTARARSLLAPAALFVVLLAPYLAFKLAYYGALLPNTVHAKEPYLPDALRYTALGTWPLVPLVAGLVLELVRGTLSRERRELFWLWLAFVVACLALGPDWMPASRFLLPSVPLIAVAGDAVIGRGLAGLRSAGGWRRGVLAVLALLAYSGANAVETHELQALAQDWEWRNEVSRNLARKFASEGVRSIGVVNIGMLGYAAPTLTFLDLAGLVDAEIARGPGRHVQKQPSDAYLLARAPDLYILASKNPITPDSTGRATYVAFLPVEEYVFARPWFNQRYRYAGSTQLFRSYFYHMFRRR